MPLSVTVYRYRLLQDTLTTSSHTCLMAAYKLAHMRGALRVLKLLTRCTRMPGAGRRHLLKTYVRTTVDIFCTLNFRGINTGIRHTRH